MTDLCTLDTGRRNGSVPGAAPCLPSSPLRPLAAGLVLAACLSLPLPPAQAADGVTAFVPGRVLVQARPGLPESELDKIIKPHGAKRAGKIDGIDVHVLQLPAKASEKAIAALLAKNKHLKFAELDPIVSPAATANDPYYTKAWHLPKIGVPTAWDMSMGDGVVIAILDTGLNTNHEDLVGRTVPGWNFYDNNADTSDVHGHGTAVAGAAVAGTNNGKGVAAIAGNAYVMPVRIADANAQATGSAIAQGLVWAADRGAKVANISYHGIPGNLTVQSAAKYMKNKGGLVVVAAGNTSAEIVSPADDSMIFVSATDANDVKTSWSSWGNYVDVAAPGVSIYTTDRGGGYRTASGTSLASPVVAGVVGLMMAANPKLGPADLEKVLFTTARDLGSAGFDSYYGHGRVDAAAAVQAALTTVAKDTIAPTVSITSPGAGSTVKGLVAVDVAASDNVGVARVDLVVNGKQLASDASAPFGFSWDSTQVADGNASLTVYAYDAAGNAASHSVSVKVANTPDLIAPTASITSPANGATVSGTVTVRAGASDNVGVSGMTLYINGQQVATSSGGSLSYSWNTRKLAAGNHTLKVEARDAAGNVGSHSITVRR
jgi:thermitase